ncbi:MAG TPA: homocysteine S-methyltransferase family protein, partial [Pyrinomonadaceae bacterium]|nr:homocysteine S-methyltransferase family protein [Pyrinomonadaceae bacterium]
MEPFRELLETDRIHVVDGAMGTMLYAKGVYINRCYDELNLSNPDLVREIHTEYIRAGADIIETNTFGATAHKLQQYGLEANLHEINALAARIAREAAGDRAYVAGAIGPLGLRIEPYGPTSFEEAKDLFKAQATGLLEGDVDLFCLETFSDISEIRQAIAAIRELCDLPIVAQMTIMTDGNTLFGTTPELFTERLDNWGADVIGLNCGVGPAIILSALEKMRAVTKKKLSAQPN